MNRLAEISFSNARSNVMISAEFLDICIVEGWFGFSGRLWTYVRDGRLLDQWYVSLIRIILKNTPKTQEMFCSNKNDLEKR